MEIKLKVLSGTHAGKVIRLSTPRFLIGRSEQCHLRAGSDLISRQHCAINISSDGVTVEDFGSKNGTLVNGERVGSPQILHSGDHLQVGPLQFEVLQDTGVGGKKRPPVKSVTEAAQRVADPTPSIEDSISSWLGESNQAGTNAANETQTLHLNDTSKFSPAELPGQSDEKESADPPSEIDSAQATTPPPKSPKISGPKTIGKLPPRVTPKAKDSREAAANILREMARRR